MVVFIVKSQHTLRGKELAKRCSAWVEAYGKGSEKIMLIKKPMKSSSHLEARHPMLQTLCQATLDKNLNRSSFEDTTDFLEKVQKRELNFNFMD